MNTQVKRRSSKNRKSVVVQPKAAANAYTASVLEFKEPKVSHDEMFGHLLKPYSRTLGEDMQLIRAWMYQQGIPEIAERTTAQAFAMIASRFMLPRRQWPFFEVGPVGKLKAKAWIASTAAELFYNVAGSDSVKPQPVLHKDMIPEIAAIYSPEYIGRAVQ